MGPQSANGDFSRSWDATLADRTFGLWERISHMAVEAAPRWSVGFAGHLPGRMAVAAQAVEVGFEKMADLLGAFVAVKAQAAAGAVHEVVVAADAVFRAMVDMGEVHRQRRRLCH